LHGSSNLRAIPDGIRVLRTIITEHRRLRRPHRAGAGGPAGFDGELVGEST